MMLIVLFCSIIYVLSLSQRILLCKKQSAIKTQYLDEEQGKKNPTDRSVLGVRDCSWDLNLTMLFAK